MQSTKSCLQQIRKNTKNYHWKLQGKQLVNLEESLQAVKFPIVEGIPVYGPKRDGIELQGCIKGLDEDSWTDGK